MHELAERLLAHDFEGAIFDFDGTIAFTSHIWEEVDRAFLGSRGIEYTTEYANKLATLGFGPGAQYTIDTYGLSETVEDLHREWSAISKELYARDARLRPGAEAYIMALRDRGVPCALATTNDPDVLASIRHVDVDALFDTCVHGSDVGCGKDKPDIFVEAARRLDVAPEDCLVFEDIAPAICSAKSVGMLTCGVRANDPMQDAEAVLDAADLWLDDWRDVAV